MARKKLGKYEIIDRIGRGGMAEVYRGYHAALDRYVAIKLLHPFLADDPEFKDRFENEARNVAKLKHPNIVQVYDFEYDEEGDSYYMVMEMINGPTLKDRLFDQSTNGERFRVAEAIRTIKSAAEALAYAHQRSMIHRDVKPANLMLDEDGRVVLTDFGIAKIVTGAQFTASGGMVGTPAYMAPEQGLGEAGDERSDVYSLGVILYQLVTGRLPYDADTPLAVILKHVNDPLPDPRQHMPDLADDLAAIVIKALAKEPDERYQSAADIALDLGSLDENGRRISFPTPTAEGRSPYDTRPMLSPSEQQRLLNAMAERQAQERDAMRSTPPGSAGTTSAQVQSQPTGPTPPANAQTGETGSIPAAPPVSSHSGRLGTAQVLLSAVALIAIIFTGLLVFGGDDGPLSGFLGGGDDTATPQLTLTAQAIAALQASETPTPRPSATFTDEPPPTEIPLQQTASPTATPRRTATPRITQTPIASETNTPDPSPTLTQTPSPTRSPTPSRTSTLTRTPTPSITPSPTPSSTPTPDTTGTALANFFETQAAASPTPNMTQTLQACTFEYIVVQPERYNLPPARNDFQNSRLIQAGTEFTLEIVLRNTGNCAWPSGTRLSFNPNLTADPGDSVNLQAARDACDQALLSGMNFAEQQQGNFLLTREVSSLAESQAISFTGEAPTTAGCYYGVWDLLYPNSTLPIGRPLLLTINVWGSG